MKMLNLRAAALLAILGSLPMLASAQTAIDGRWKSTQSDEVVTFSTEGSRVSMVASTGFGYTAKLDGSDAPAKGDKSVDTVSVTMPDKSTLVETSKKDGKPWLTMRMQVDASGKIAKVSWQNLKTHKSGGYEMLRQ
jgi:hypothetical protein